MDLSSSFGLQGQDGLQILWNDGQRVFCRGWYLGPDGRRGAALAVLPVMEHPAPATLDRLAHEYGLKDELDAAWAVRPLELARERGRTMLLLEDPGGEPLTRLLGAPIEVGRFLHLAIRIAASLSKLHRRGLVHKDLKPAHILVNGADERVLFTGFGIATRLPRERQTLEPTETIAGTLAYMAPEQTGRMNRSIDSRSDLYSIGVTFYQMLTGSLPFVASDPMEWVHCHIVRQPVTPSRRQETVPLPLSRLVMKLLAKTAEERYQTAAGLESDLRRCLAMWEAERSIDDFPLGENDTPDRLLIPEKLYGRERELELLLASFDRIVTGGGSELVLISGYSGIGKSSVVNELHKALVPRGLFVSGKFDQYKCDIPYSTLAQAFQSLIRRLLGKSDAELAGWRDAMLAALGPNGRLMIDLVPELTLIVGDQPPVAELGPRQAQSRFQFVFRQFIGVFARPEHPLVLFFDDLQWLDAATLDLLEDLLTRSDLPYLLLIGAYRDNEVDEAHPLMRKLNAIRQAGAQVQDIRLAPLARDDLGQLIADALRCKPVAAAPLAALVHDKTAGNPIFVTQFLYTLADEGLLRFDHDAACWCWDLDGINAKGYTDNVVDLMVGKLTRLPADTQQALQQLACLGSTAALAMLSAVLGKSEEQVHAVLWAAVSQELIERLDGRYRFVHDRVYEAAYSVIPPALRAEAHLRIGRLLVAQTPQETREEAIFEIVNQFNRGAALLTEQEERDQLAELNLIAGQRAKAATAYASALTFLTAGVAMLPNDPWERCPKVSFALELHRAECEFLIGELAKAEQRLEALSIRAVDTVERATVACLRIDLYTTLDHSSRAIAVGLDYLRHLGIEWSAHPKDEETQTEYERIWLQLGTRLIEELIELPLMSDPVSLATMDVLTKIGPPALHTDSHLFSLVTCRAVNLSLESGNCDGSCFAYVRLGMVAGSRFGDYQAAYRFGRLGHDLVERQGLRRFEARTTMCFGGLVLPWVRHVRAGRDLLRRGLQAANQTGDLVYAACGFHLMTNLLAAGEPLVDVQREAENALEFARKAQFEFIIDITAAQLDLIRSLRGLAPRVGSFDNGPLAELGIDRRSTRSRDLQAQCSYFIRKLQGDFFAGDYRTAIEVSLSAQSLLWTLVSHFETAEYHFYGALSRAAACNAAPAVERQQHVAALMAHYKQLQVWGTNCPENFENRVALVGAEIARIEGRIVDAEHLYEQAIRSAQTNGFVHNEAIANEVAGRFYAGRGLEKIARLYLRSARYGYLRWGATGKVRQLDGLYQHLREEEPTQGPTGTIGAPLEHLDLATVIKVSQAVSGEIVLEKLIDTLMRIAIEQAGAERGLLILPRGAGLRIEAEGTTGGDTIIVQLRGEPVSAAVLPESVFHYVLRTQDSVILDEAAGRSPFASDPYFLRRQTRSILCLPLITQGKVIGVLYLESNLTRGAFAPGGIAVLKLLASQAAIALENARLYGDLAEREAKIRRLVDANIIGICISRREGDIIEANDAFLKIVAYDRDDLVAGRVRWTDLTTPSSSDRTAHAMAELQQTGTIQPFEKEYFRRDGSRVPVLVGVAAFDEEREQLVAFVLDLTERKLAEAEARESERRYHEIQGELAHANRVATMGQLTASIAHEVNQPIAAAVTNAHAGIRWLSGQRPNLEEARQALARVLENSNRAGEVIGRIRAIIEKAPPRKDSVAINDAILEVIDLTQGEAAKHGISVRTELAEALPPIEGDRVQLQQVILNLIINAIEAMSRTIDAHRELRVSTVRAGSDGILVAVLDSGPGLAPATRERAFEAFYTSKPSGLGMGLSICRSIVGAHGGRLWATAHRPRGAIFQFTVPIRQGGAS